MGGGDSVLSEVATVKPDPNLDGRWPELGTIGYGNGSNSSNFQSNYSMSRTFSCPPSVAAAAAATAAAVEFKRKESVSVDKISSPKKRKVEKMQKQSTKVVPEEDSKSSSNNQNNKKETSSDYSKENSKVSDVQKLDYIHVRARRGQATDSHSLAERVRREKISERMKYLQDLVPGCNKITGKAGMLDEIINYVQSLQRQVEFLSMKLSTVNPRLDFTVDNLFVKEVNPVGTTSFPTIGMSTEMANTAYVRFDPGQQQVTCAGMEMGINPNDMGLRRTISAPPVPVPEAFINPSSIATIQPPSTWDADLQNLYTMAFN